MNSSVDGPCKFPYDASFRGCPAAELSRGRQSIASLKKLLGKSRLTDGPAEGLYVRKEAHGLLQTRAKLVRAEFVQAIEEHWSKRQLEENQLAPSAGPRNAWR